MDCAIECRAKIMAAEAECSSSSDKLECIIRVLVEDNEAACIGCICDVLGGGGGGDPTECLYDIPGMIFLFPTQHIRNIQCLQTTT